MSHALVVGGVSGTGKTTVARALAERLGRPFKDADDLHPPANRAKMAAGTPLDDEDRWPWLDVVAEWLASHPTGVCACSALAKRHRDRLRAGAAGVQIVMLTAPPEVLTERLKSRRGHYMPPMLLDSQLATYEPLSECERGMTMEATASVERLVTGIVDRFDLG